MSFKISLNQANIAKLASKAKAKAEADAKEREEELALNLVLADFKDEHGDSDPAATDADQMAASASNFVVPTGAQRHFAGRVRTGKSGPGTLEPEPSYGFPGRFNSQFLPRFGGSVQGLSSLDSSRQDENVYATITAKVSNLPPETDQHTVEMLFTDFPSLKVVKIEKVPPLGPSHRGRPSVAMMVTFDKDATQTDFNKALSKLNDKKYLGRGYYVHMDRYLGAKHALSLEQNKEEPPPFGAQWKAPEVAKGFAPPPDLGGFGGIRQSREDNERLVVTVERPRDLATLKLIHQTVEGVIRGGMEFEAALMQDPRVTDDEKFVWLYDSKHPHNIYYRWRLYELISGTTRPEVFLGQAEWEGPSRPLPEEFANHIGCIFPDLGGLTVEDEDKPPRGFVDSFSGPLSPWDRSFLIYLLARLPASGLNAGDLAPFTAFTVEHITQGLGEIIHTLITNIFTPFNLMEDAKADNRPDGDEYGQTPNNVTTSNPSSKQDDADAPQKRRIATTNGLRIISDIALTSFKDRNLSYTWKCRQAIGEELVDRKVFEYLDQFTLRLKNGLFSENSFRDEVNSILKVWEHETLFDKKMIGRFQDAFNERKRKADLEKKQEARMRERARKAKVRVDRGSSGGEDKMDVDGNEASAIGGMDGPSDEAAEAPSPQTIVETIEASTPPASIPAPAEVPGETAAARARRMRPKAEDMFASDEE